MTDVVNVLFSGLGGALLSGATTLYVSRRKKRGPTRKTTEASDLLEKIGINTNDSQGDYYLTKDSDSILGLVSDIYGNAAGKIIATAFHEDPVAYGKSDAIRRFKAGDFTRITNEEICSPESEITARKSLEEAKPGSFFISIPKGESYTRLDGIFIRMRRESYLAMITFRNPNSPSQNTCVLFRDGLAKEFYDYFKELANKYGVL